MAGKIISAGLLLIIGIAALSDFITVHHGRLDQFGFLCLTAGILSLSAGVLSWRCWDQIREGYTYRQTETDGVELPRVAWSERLGMGALFNLRDHPEPRQSKN